MDLCISLSIRAFSSAPTSLLELELEEELLELSDGQMIMASGSSAEPLLGVGVGFEKVIGSSSITSQAALAILARNSSFASLIALGVGYGSPMGPALGAVTGGLGDGFGPPMVPFLGPAPGAM